MDERLPSIRRPKGGYYDTHRLEREKQVYYLGWPELLLLSAISLGFLALAYIMWLRFFRG
jgi:hypothetical protein